MNVLLPFVPFASETVPRFIIVSSDFRKIIIAFTYIRVSPFFPLIILFRELSINNLVLWF